MSRSHEKLSNFVKGHDNMSNLSKVMEVNKFVIKNTTIIKNFQGSVTWYSQIMDWIYLLKVK